MSEQDEGTQVGGGRFSRRRLLGTGAALGGASVLANALPPALQRAAAAEPRFGRGSLSQIEHVVILIQENRSFDHYFGTMPGVRGFNDPTAITLPDGQSVFYQPDPSNPDGYVLPFRLNTEQTTAAAINDPTHDWTPQHETWDNGKMDQWVPVHSQYDGAAYGPLVMGYYTAEDLPFHYALAQAFTHCDNYHCSVFGPTVPNRLYVWTGMIDPNGTGGGPEITDDPEGTPDQKFTWTTYAEQLQDAGISWRNYQQTDNGEHNPLAWFANFENASTDSPLYQRGIQVVDDVVEAFAEDIRTDNLPQVSWLIGPYGTCEHPSQLPAAGGVFISQLLEVLASNPRMWEKTAFFITYDENGGFFDHVVPPTPPAGTPDEFVDNLPIGLGYRVPAIMVSPLSVAGGVCSQVFDHTSILQFLEKVFGVEAKNVSDWRRQTCGDLTATLNIHRPEPRWYPRQFPTLPSAAPSLLDQYVTSQDGAYPGPSVPTNQEFPPPVS